MKIFKQLLKAYEVMYKSNVIHRDIKPDNILFHNNEVILADFGFCNILKPGKKLYKRLGSPLFMAPEMLNGKPYDLMVDIYSLGITLY